LSVIERRILGVLVEKQKTTDTYPLSLNAVVTGSNQKSNRDPMLELSEDQVDEGLVGLQKKGLVVRVVSGRVDKWKHVLYEAWSVNSVELAVLAELLLRGPQTEGELRARASRMEPITDIDALRQVLGALKERKLVVYLTPEGRRGTMLTHGFHDPAELERLKSRQPAIAPDEAPSGNSSAAVALEARLLAAESQIAQLGESVDAMKAQIAGFAERFARLEQETGTPRS
jgi:uncharacterized protein YceH (UPF0502 family)